MFIKRELSFHGVPAKIFWPAVQWAGVQVRHGRLVIETLRRYSAAEYSTMQCFLTSDTLTGYAIKPDGELVSLFNTGPSWRGDCAVASAVQNGATKLNAFDENDFLPALYRRHGFVEYQRTAWNDQHAPPVWNGTKPDVVSMSLDLSKILCSRSRSHEHPSRPDSGE